MLRLVGFIGPWMHPAAAACRHPERYVARMATESSAATVWQGSLADGSGNVAPSTGAFEGVEVTWAARTSRTQGKTSPEELLAMAHSSCFCMALSHALGEDGHEPERLEATATVSFEPGEGVKSSHIVV